MKYIRNIFTVIRLLDDQLPDQMAGLNLFEKFYLAVMVIRDAKA